MDILYILGYVIAINFLWRFSRYISTPVLKMIGYYKYYSPMFLTMPVGLKKLDFHLGTSFDFFHNKNVNRKNIMLYMVEGLINVCEEVERGKIDRDTLFTGNTFYFTPTTAKRFGFKYRKLHLFEKLLFALNFVELNILHYLTTKKFSLIPVSNVLIVYTKAADMVKNKPKLIELRDKLYRNSGMVANKLKQVKNKLT